MTDINPIYFRRRAVEERELARQSSDRFAQMLHEHMAIECEKHAGEMSRLREEQLRR